MTPGEQWDAKRFSYALLLPSRKLYTPRTFLGGCFLENRDHRRPPTSRIYPQALQLYLPSPGYCERAKTHHELLQCFPLASGYKNLSQLSALWRLCISIDSEVCILVVQRAEVYCTYSNYSARTILGSLHRRIKALRQVLDKSRFSPLQIHTGQGWCPVSV